MCRLHGEKKIRSTNDVFRITHPRESCTNAHTHTRADRIDLPMLQCEKLNASSHSAHTGQKKAQLIEMDEKKKKCSVGFSQGKIETNDDVYLYLLTSMSKFIFFSFETQ